MNLHTIMSKFSHIIIVLLFCTANITRRKSGISLIHGQRFAQFKIVHHQRGEQDGDSVVSNVEKVRVGVLFQHDYSS